MRPAFGDRLRFLVPGLLLGWAYAVSLLPQFSTHFIRADLGMKKKLITQRQAASELDVSQRHERHLRTTEAKVQWIQRVDKAATENDNQPQRAVGWGEPSADGTLRKISIKEFAMFYRHGLGGLFAVLLGLLSHNAARADLIFVSNGSIGTIGEYTTAGATVNPALISGVDVRGIAVSGSDLFVSNFINGTIGQYTTSGAPVNPALISGLRLPWGIAVSGSDLFVSNIGNGTIGQYTTAGATVNPALISGLSGPNGIAVSGSDLFVVNQTSATIGAYTTAGFPVNPALISGLSNPYAITVVATVPEPGSCTLALFGLVLAGVAIRKIERKWHDGCGWAYPSGEKANTHGPPLPGLVGGRPFAHVLRYGAPLLILMTAWAILLLYAA